MKRLIVCVALATLVGCATVPQNGTQTNPSVAQTNEEKPIADTIKDAFDKVGDKLKEAGEWMFKDGVYGWFPYGW